MCSLILAQHESFYPSCTLTQDLANEMSILFRGSSKQALQDCEKLRLSCVAKGNGSFAHQQSATMFLLFNTLVGLLIATYAQSQEFVIAGYLPDYRLYIDLNHAAQYLSDVMLFSVEPSADGSLSGCCVGADHFNALKTAEEWKENSLSSPLHRWITVGGGGRSNHFVGAIRQNPSQLVQSVIDLAQKHNFHGIDMDCEHFASQQDYMDYVQWLYSEAIPKIHSAGLKVSISIHVGMILPQPIYESADRIHFMTYDMLRGGNEDKNHGSLAKMVDAVEKLLSSGCPPHKVIIGIPSYLRHGERPGEVLTFAEVADQVTESSSSEELETMSSWKGFLGDFSSSVKQKVLYARQKGLGGVFFWEIGQDKHGEVAGGHSLLQAAHKASGLQLHRTDEL